MKTMGLVEMNRMHLKDQTLFVLVCVKLTRSGLLVIGIDCQHSWIQSYKGD